jgi:hypothetical protein
MPTHVPNPTEVPEDICSELDREERLEQAELQLELTEGQPPADQDEAQLETVVAP